MNKYQESSLAADLSEVPTSQPDFYALSGENAKFYRELSNRPLPTHERLSELLEEIRGYDRIQEDYDKRPPLTPAENELIEGSVRMALHFCRVSCGIGVDNDPDKEIVVYGKLPVSNLRTLPISFDDRFGLAIEGLSSAAFVLSTRTELSWQSIAYGQMYSNVTRNAQDYLPASLRLAGHMQNNTKLVIKAIDELEDKGIVSPTKQEVTDYMLGPSERVEAALVALTASRVVSLTSVDEVLRPVDDLYGAPHELDDDTPPVWQETIAAPDSVYVLDEDSRERAVSQLLSMADISVRQEQVLSLRLMSEDPLTLEGVALEFGVTRERIRQIESKAIGKMRHIIDAYLLKDELVEAMRVEYTDNARNDGVLKISDPGAKLKLQNNLPDVCAGTSEKVSTKSRVQRPAPRRFGKRPAPMWDD